ncbi:MAG: 4Fe-4S binding protein [Candidatus Helarchaeota archaeon]
MQEEINVELTEKIKEICLKAGADKIGIAEADKASGSSQGHADPKNLISAARSIIVIALKFPDSAIDCRHEDDLIHANFIAVQNAMNEEHARIGFKISRFLEKLGYDSIPVAPDIPREESRNIWVGALSHKYVAQLAGLGEIGLSNLFLTPEWGPRVSLSCIVTDAPLKPDGPKLVDKVCTKCNKCVEACPTRALASDNYPPFNYNLNRCLWATMGFYRLTKVEEPPEDWINAKPNANIALPKYEEKYPQIRVYENWALKLGDFPQCIACMAACPIGKEGHKKRTEGE